MNLDVFKSINGYFLIAKIVASAHESGGETSTASLYETVEFSKQF